MVQALLDEVAYLFVEAYDSIHGIQEDRSAVRRIRKAADDGEDGFYAVVASVFGDNLDKVFIYAANWAMDCIAYVDETWTPKDANDKAKMIEIEKLHLESVNAILQIAWRNNRHIADQIKGILLEAEEHFQHVQAR